MDRLFGLKKNVFFLGITSFLNDFSAEMVQSVMPAFFISVLKSGAGSIGIVEGVADAAANLMKIYSGRLSDRLQRRKVFATIGYSISVATRPFYALVGSVGGVVGLRVIDRIGKGLRDSPRDALISLSSPKAEMSWSFGYHRAMDTMGAILGPLAAFAILFVYPEAFSLVFIAAFFAGLLAVLSLVWVCDVAATMLQPLDQSSRFRHPPGFAAYITSVFVLAAGALPVAVLLFRTQDLGFSLTSIPLFYAIYGVIFALASWPAGRLADQWGTGRVIVVGYLFLILSYAVLALSSDILTLILGLAALGLFSAFTDGVQRAHLASLVGEGVRGRGFGAFGAATGFGALIAGAAGGFVWEQFGSNFALWLASAATAIGLLVFLYSLRISRAPMGI